MRLVQPNAAGRICDRLHAENIGSEHRFGFCLACASAYLLLNVLTEQEVVDLAVEWGYLTPQTCGKDGEHLEQPRVFIRQEHSGRPQEAHDG